MLARALPRHKGLRGPGHHPTEVKKLPAKTWSHAPPWPVLARTLMRADLQPAGGVAPHGPCEYRVAARSLAVERAARAPPEEVHVTAEHVMGLVVAMAALGAGLPARAALGEPAASVDRDRRALSMERQAPRLQAGVAVHELRKPTQTVREFVDPSGTVFAVAWSGGAAPDLPQLLGAYYAEYRAAAARRTAARGPRRVESEHVIVETWGHGRALHGRAWLPALVPPGANLDDVQ
jgi:hypothetical protein